MDKLTLEQVAELAGVSRSTVSRVINNQPSVKPEVRQRVLEIVAQTGYQPDLAARSLAGQHTGIIGIIIPRAVQSLFTDPYFPRLIQGIAKACNANDYNLSLFLFHTEDEERKLYPRVLRTQQVDGVIVTSSNMEDPLIAQLIENQVPFIIIGRPNNMPGNQFCGRGQCRRRVRGDQSPGAAGAQADRYNHWPAEYHRWTRPQAGLPGRTQ